MATLSSVLAWRIPWTEELVGSSPCGLNKQGMTEATQRAFRSQGSGCLSWTFSSASH